MSFLNIFIAILGLALSTAAKTTTATISQSSPIYCSASNLFIQFSNFYSICTLSYLLSLYSETVELFAYDDQGIEIGHVRGVGTEKDYAFHTQLKDTIILNFDAKGAEFLVLSYWCQRKKHIVTTEYTTRCFESATENGGTIGCEMMFECSVPLSTPKSMSARSTQTS